MFDASSTLRKQRNPALPFSGKMRSFGKVPYHQLHNAIRNAHANFAPLDFINEKITGKQGKLTSPSLKVLTNYFCAISAKI